MLIRYGYEINLLSVFLLINCAYSFPKILISDDEVIDDISNLLTDNVAKHDETNKYNKSSASLWRMTGSLDEILQFQSNIMKSYMDNTIDPCEDFYLHACGNWDKIHPIPKDNSEFNVFSFLTINMMNSLRDILIQPFQNKTKNFKLSDLNAEDKSKLFYSICTDMATLNQRGNEPLLNFIDSLGGWPVLDDNWNEENFDFLKLCAKTSSLGHEYFFNFDVEMDLKDTKRHIIYIAELSLGLQNREDFLLEENSAHLSGYKNLIITILTLLDVDNEKAEETANEIINFETELANVTTEDRLKITFNDHYVGITLGEISENNSKINLTRLFNLVFGRNFSSDQNLVLFSNPNFDKMIEFLANSDKRILANYIVWRNVQSTYRHLDERFLSAGQTFDEALTGQKEPTPHWLKCVEHTNSKMGMAVGAQFVRTYFDENSKKDVEKLTEEIINVFKRTLRNLYWIDDETKRKSEEKANTISLAVGYPDFILSIEKLNKFYASLSIQRGKHFENVLSLNLFEKIQQFKNLEKKPDKEKWPSYPAIINAFFEPTKNRIVIPAGVLQPPIYHNKLPKALNYGGIGVFVGHELTHGFDDAGREFDSDGNMITWWSNASIEQFTERTDCFIDQYNEYSLYEKFLSGESSKSENIADNGGIRQAFMAYKKWLETATAEDLAKERIPDFNLTYEQLYFLGFAQAWCGQIRPEAIENLIATDAHCPGRFRVLGTLQNFDEFSKAYKCSNKTKMNPPKKCRLW